MGKKIDRFVLSAALAIGSYLLIHQRIPSQAVSIVLAVLSCALVGSLLRKASAAAGRSAYLKKMEIRKKSCGTVMHLACMDEKLAHAKLAALIAKVYHEESPLEVLQYPPSASLDQRSLFDCWKKHRGEDRLVICATCKCEQQVQALASGMKKPRVALVDADAIRNMIAEFPEEMAPEEHVSRIGWFVRVKKLSALLFNRRNVPRCLLFALSMLGIYLLNGRTSYLVSSMALLFCAFASLHRAPRPAKLF